MALLSALTSLTIWFYLPLLLVNATIIKEFLHMGQSLGTSDSLVSFSGNFELGFFSRNRENSIRYYVGIWFKMVPNDKIVWVANRVNQVETSSAFLTIQPDGNLEIVDGAMTYHVNNVRTNYGTYATLLDSGNLVLVNSSNQAILWQSFDYPTDTILPGMGIRADTRSLRSWTSSDDPAPGPFSLQFQNGLGYSNPVILKGSHLYWVYDHSNIFDGFHYDRSTELRKGVYADYYTWGADNNSRMVLEVSGDLKTQSWSEDSKRWITLQSSKCGTNTTCGAFTICNPENIDPCDCLEGFKPFDWKSWSHGNRSAGCVRKTELACSNTTTSNTSSDGNDNKKHDGFQRLLTIVDLSSNSYRFEIDTVLQCETACSAYCSCVAYVYDYNGTCYLWDDHVFNLKNVSADDQSNAIKVNFYLRLAASELLTKVTPDGKKPTNDSPDRDNRSRDMLLIVLLIPFLTLIVLGLFVYWTRRQRRKGEDLLHFEVGMTMKVKESDSIEADKSARVKKKEVKLPLFSFASVSAATNNFSNSNKLGEGGFGPVYKGKLLNGDEVAVKRLSRRSGQGWEELRNEALLIAKLQHNNLVRLLGCCIDRDEKMLIYEFMPNKSLDYFLFDAAKRRVLDWETRVRIIDGIAQGLLYLHQYSRFRIIHRDLKASNILLDINMNPKISDFGLARIFGENELQANTNRIVGTYGYMSPEYAMEGIFSIKSDVFSFGVLLLEIVSGKKNTGFYQTNSFHLLGYAWDLWTSNSGRDLMDPLLEDASRKDTVTRYVNIGLLCVQESPTDRPTMSDVVSMIGNDAMALPRPKPPAFLNVRGNENSRLTDNMPIDFSVNVITDSLVEAR